MYKLIMSGSYDFNEPPLQLMDVHSKGVDKAWLQKRAAVLTRELADIRPRPGKAFIHLIALGDTEAYGPNRNGDGFRKQANRERHHTFVTNGHLFRHHQNKDPEKALGKVAYSAHNEPMSRVELIVEADEEKCRDEIEKVAKADPDMMQAASMACKVAYDVCSVCGNQARSREEYCKHAKDMMGQILSDGRQVYVDNPNPTYFDISFVVRPADRIAYGLRKVASGLPVSGAELAELYEYTPRVDYAPVLPRRIVSSSIRLQKLAVMRKLSEIEKQIDGAISGLDFNGQGSRLVKLRGAFTGKNTPISERSSGQQLGQAAAAAPKQVAAALARYSISLPIERFLELFGGEKVKEADCQAVRRHLPGIYTRMLEQGDELAADGAYDAVSPMALSKAAMVAARDLAQDYSLDAEPVRQRLAQLAVRKLAAPELTPPSRIRTIKFATAADASEALAKEYAKYKLSLLTELSGREGSDLQMELGVLQDYV